MDPNSHRKTFKKSAPFIRGRAAGVSPANLVRMDLPASEDELLRVYRPTVEGVGLTEWAAIHRDSIEAQLLRNGALLFRGFEPCGISGFEEFIKALSGELLDYTYRSTPRSHVGGKIYTSTEYPSHQHIPPHNEMAYTQNWPLRICFYCVEPAAQGGETPLADSRKVFARISPEVRERFMRDGVMYVRNYGDDLDLSWEDVFQTSDRSEVEAFCRHAGIEAEWRSGGRLRTRQVCQAVVRHPHTGEISWFNQAHLFHVSALEPEVRASLLSAFGEADLPRNAYYGDGTAIEPSAMDEVREAYRLELFSFPWQQGDVLLLDNILVAHARTPFVGTRKVVVGMAGPSRGSEI